MSKKKFLPEGDIFALDVPRADLSERLRGMSTDALIDLVIKLRTSAIIALRAAASGWRLWDAWRNGVITKDIETEFESSYHDYSPGNFPRHLGEVEVLCDELEILREDMEGLSADECRELVEKRRDDYLEVKQRQLGNPPIPRTPR